MIKIGNMLINPDDISSIHQEKKPHLDNRDRGFIVIQIIYKNGVVKNITTNEIGVNSYEDFIAEFQKQTDKQETDRIFRLMTAIKSMQNG